MRVCAAAAPHLTADWGLCTCMCGHCWNRCSGATLDCARFTMLRLPSLIPPPPCLLLCAVVLSPLMLDKGEVKIATIASISPCHTAPSRPSPRAMLYFCSLIPHASSTSQEPKEATAVLALTLELLFFDYSRPLHRQLLSAVKRTSPACQGEARGGKGEREGGSAAGPKIPQTSPQVCGAQDVGVEEVCTRPVSPEH